ncbi:nucleotidyltransferase family protein [Bdellovibrionota bacterium FG-2]
MADLTEPNEHFAFLRALVRPHTYASLSGLPSPPPFLKNSPDWYRLFELAENTNSLPFLCETLTRVAWNNQLPENVQLWLEERKTREKIKALVNADDFRASCYALKSERIPYVILSSAQLWNEIYPAFMPRASERHEILIDPEDYFATLRAMGKAGFRSREKTAPFATRVTVYRPHSANGFTLVRDLEEDENGFFAHQIRAHSVEVRVPRLETITRRITFEFRLLHTLFEAASGEPFISAMRLLDFSFLISKLSQDPVFDLPRFVSMLQKRQCVSIAYVMQGILSGTDGLLFQVLGDSLSTLRKKVLDRHIQAYAWPEAELTGVSANPGLLSRLKFLLRDRPLDLSPARDAATRESLDFAP